MCGCREGENAEFPLKKKRRKRIGRKPNGFSDETPKEFFEKIFLAIIRLKKKVRRQAETKSEVLGAGNYWKKKIWKEILEHSAWKRRKFKCKVETWTERSGGKS